jgi:RimJ/RimL family protein N-acetyltransferase
MSGEVRVLGSGDEPLLVSFLEKHLESSVFLLSNVERAGVVDCGEPRQATYAANVTGGGITAVVAHAWNGNLLVQGDFGLEDAARLATTASGRAVKGIMGPAHLVRRARSALGLESRAVARDLPDVLFVLELDALRVPALITDGAVSLRFPTDDELVAPLAGWRAHYMEEVLGAVRTPELEERALQGLRHWHSIGDMWVLERQGELVAMTGFSGKTRGIVQVGGVYAPPELRRNGYARAAVAASLLVERERGATRSTLFTGADNTGAVRTYTTLGYRAFGDFELLLFR